MARYEEIGFWGETGANFREDLFGPVQRGRFGALNDFLIDSQCVLLGALESGTRNAGLTPLANGWAFTRGFNGCYSGAPPPFVKGDDIPPLYEGGQCVGDNYRVRVGYDNSVRGPGVTNNIFPGPIVDISVIDSPQNPGQDAVAVFHNDQQGVPTFSQVHIGFAGETVTITGIVELTNLSGPDNCGSLPTIPGDYPDGQELPPAPSPGDVIAPGRDIVVPVDTPGGTVDFGVNIGDATFCQDNSICITVDGVPHRIRPDGGIDYAPDEPGGSEPPSSDSSDIEDIKELLETQIEGEFTWANCEGEPLTAGYSGQGFGVVEGMLQTLLPLVNSGVFQYCSLLSPDEFEGTLLNTTSLPSLEIDTFVDVALDVATKKAVVEVVSSFPQYSVRRDSQGGNDDRQTRFAVVSFVYEIDGEECISWTRNQYYSKGVYDIELISLDSREIRVSLKAGSSATVKEFA